MKIIKNKFFLYSVLFIFYSTFSLASESHFIDFKKVLNTSKAGAQAQTALKNKFENESKKFRKEEEDIRKEEAQIISQKKLISNDEFKKKVEILRKKVSDLQKNRQKSIKKISQSRTEAKKALLKAVNPILKKYMEENSINLVLDKESIILGNSELEITDQIIAILNKELSSLKIN